MLLETVDEELVDYFTLLHVFVTVWAYRLLGISIAIGITDLLAERSALPAVGRLVSVFIMEYLTILRYTGLYNLVEYISNISSLFSCFSSSSASILLP